MWNRVIRPLLFPSNPTSFPANLSTGEEVHALDLGCGSGALAMMAAPAPAPPPPAGEEVHALDLGCGSGALAMMAARAGAESVVAVDALEGLCTLARKNVALHALGRRVSDIWAEFR